MFSPWLVCHERTIVTAIVHVTIQKRAASHQTDSSNWSLWYARPRDGLIWWDLGTEHNKHCLIKPNLQSKTRTSSMANFSAIVTIIVLSLWKRSRAICLCRLLPTCSGSQEGWIASRQPAISGEIGRKNMLAVKKSFILQATTRRHNVGHATAHLLVCSRLTLFLWMKAISNRVIFHKQASWNGDNWLGPLQAWRPAGWKKWRGVYQGCFDAGW